LNSNGQAQAATRSGATFAAAAGAVIATLAVAVAVVIGEDVFPLREPRKRKTSTLETELSSRTLLGTSLRRDSFALYEWTGHNFTS
jgi:hypothetical protein